MSCTYIDEPANWKTRELCKIHTVPVPTADPDGMGRKSCGSGQVTTAVYSSVVYRHVFLSIPTGPAALVFNFVSSSTLKGLFSKN